MVTAGDYSDATDDAAKQPAATGSGSGDAAALRRIQADNVVKNHVIIAMSFGLVPVPLFDLVLLAGNQVAMVKALSERYGVPFEQQRAQSIVISLVSGALPVLGVVSLSAGAKLIPGIGSLFGSGAVAITGGALTYGVGQVFAEHFATGGSLLDFEPASMRALLKRQLARGRKFVADLRAESSAGAAPVGAAAH